MRSGPIRLSELAAIEGINPTMLSRVVGDLTAAGLLQRVSDPEDRRAALVQATSEGRELVERIRRERTDVLNSAFAGLSEDDRATSSGAAGARGGWPRSSRSASRDARQATPAE